MREHQVVSADGTKIKVWRADGDGPLVLMCPGVGSGPESWPGLRSTNVAGWYMRGTMGSDRPADPARITLADHVADALAVLDDLGVERCVVAGWSMGVTIAAELALRHPSRVSGLLLVAGSPGDSFDSMLPVLPASLRRSAGIVGTRALQAAGPLLDQVLHRMPVNDVTTFLLRRTMIKSSSAPDDVAAAIRPFLRHDWRWYFTLALALGAVARQDLSGLRCPVTVLAGQDDVLASVDSMSAPIGSLPQARFRLLPCTHYLPLEAPDVVNDELRALLSRVEAVDQAIAFTQDSRSRT